MKRIHFLPVLALVIAVAASAFKTDEKASDVMYWFPTDDNGNITSYTISISGHTSKPCNGFGDYCALGFTEDQVIDNNNGTVTLKQEVDPLADGEPSLKE